MKQLYRKFLLVLSFCVISAVVNAAGHTVSIVSSTNVFCFGGATGTATASVSGGVGPFAYAWSPAGGTNATANNLAAGTYIVTATDQSDGSTATASVVITQPPPITVTLNVIHATCGFPNGQINAVVTGGTPGYTCMWLPSGPTGWTISNLSSGSYTIIVTDANGCSQTQSAVVGNTAGPQVLSITASPPSVCAGQSSVFTPTISGGTGPYTFNWSNPGGALNSTNVMSPTATPTMSATYTLTTIDANGCAGTGTVTLPVNQNLTANVTPTSATCNLSNGSLTTNIVSGTPPYDFAWSNGDTTQSLTNIPAGQYTVTITDAANCQSTVISGVSNVGGPAVSLAMTPASCTNYSNGSATATVTAPSPITYSWNTTPVQTTSSISGIASGVYFVTVTDSAGCITVDSVTVSALAGNLFMYATAVTPSNCNMLTGSALCVVSGGTAPYSYLWSNSTTTALMSGVSSGSYSVMVTDANGCSLSGPAQIGNVCANIVTGRVYIDMNQDNNYNSGDIPVVGSLVNCTPGYAISTDTNGIYTRLLYSSGTNVVTHTMNYYTMITPSSGSYVVSFPALGDTISGVDFVYQAANNFQDLFLTMGSGVARPGFTQQYNIHCENRGTTIASDTIWFRHDSILTVINANPPFDGYTHPEGYWLFNNFLPAQQINKSIVMQVPTINNGGYLGRQLIANARIEPMASDTSSPDNGDDEIDIIQGAYDPNLKECWSPTMDAYGDIWPTDVTLDYTIHFQNTGTDTAFTVIVVDTLPVELDITTFRMGASSHPCTYMLDSYNDTNVVTFTFMNILLPDSFVNEAASHGYVQFTIDREPNLPIGTMILNEANNYFDFNPAIVTNTDSVIITDPLVVVPVTGGVFSIYPNPANDVVNVALGQEYSGKNAVLVLRDLSGREIMRVSSNGSTQISLDINACAAGVYTLSVVAGELPSSTQKLIISEK